MVQGLQAIILAQTHYLGQYLGAVSSRFIYHLILISLFNIQVLSKKLSVRVESWNLSEGKESILRRWVDLVVTDVVSECHEWVEILSDA